MLCLLLLLLLLILIAWWLQFQVCSTVRSFPVSFISCHMVSSSLLSLLASSPEHWLSWTLKLRVPSCTLCWSVPLTPVQVSREAFAYHVPFKHKVTEQQVVKLQTQTHWVINPAVLYNVSVPLASMSPVYLILISFALYQSTNECCFFCLYSC